MRGLSAQRGHSYRASRHSLRSRPASLADPSAPEQATLHARLDLVDSRVKSSTLDLQQRLLDDFGDMEEQLDKQIARLGDLKSKYEENPCALAFLSLVVLGTADRGARADYYFCVDDPVAALENVELAPDGMSDAGTAFTRYTVNPTTAASSTRKTSCAALYPLCLSLDDPADPF